MLRRIVTYFFISVFIIGCTVKTKPVSNNDLLRFGGDKINHFYNRQAVPSHAMNLHEVVARALKYNLNRIVEDLGVRSEETLLKRKSIDLYPEMKLSVSESYRDKVYASKQLSLEDNSPISGSGNTYSSERNSRTNALEASWNLLDMWSGYVGAKIQANKVLLTREKRRKAIIELIETTVNNFWLVRTGQRYEKQSKVILQDIEKSLKNLKSPEFYENYPEDSLKRQKILLEQKKLVTEAMRRVDEKKIELLSLMGLPIGSNIKLQIHREILPVFNLAPAEADRRMFVNNPEYRIAAYEAKLAVMNSKLEFARLLPGLSLNYNWNNTTDKLRVYDSWQTGSGRLVWNMMNVFKIGTQRKHHKLNRATAEQRRLLGGVVQIARSRMTGLLYLSALEKYADDVQLHSVEKRLNKITNDKFSDTISSVSFIDLIEARAKELSTGLTRARSYAGMLEYAISQAGAVTPLLFDVDYDKVQVVQINRMVQHIMASFPLSWLNSTSSKNLKGTHRSKPLNTQINRVLTLWQNEKKQGVAEPGDKFTPGDGAKLANIKYAMEALKLPPLINPPKESRAEQALNKGKQQLQVINKKAKKFYKQRMLNQPKTLQAEQALTKGKQQLQLINQKARKLFKRRINR